MDSIAHKLEDEPELADEEFPEQLFSSKHSSKPAGACAAATSGIIDNSVLLCPHGRLNPLSDKEMKLISVVRVFLSYTCQREFGLIMLVCLNQQSAKQKIEQIGFTFKPQITVDDICTDCVKAEFLGEFKAQTSSPDFLICPQRSIIRSCIPSSWPSSTRYAASTPKSKGAGYLNHG